jgi:hypothetical protein
MHADWDTGVGARTDATPDERLDRMRSTLALHRELIDQKAEIRAQPDSLSTRLEAMVETLEPDDPPADAIRLLLEAEQVHAMQFEELDRRIDQLTESFMAGTIALAERLRPPGI